MRERAVPSCGSGMRALPVGPPLPAERAPSTCPPAPGHDGIGQTPGFETSSGLSVARNVGPYS